MPQDPRKPKDNGKIGMAPPTPGSNRLGAKPMGDPNKKSKNDTVKFNQTTDADEDAALLKRMLKRFETVVQAETKNRKAGVEDLQFKVGDQWESAIKQKRGDRPTLTVNRIPTLVHQVTNAQRENRPAIRYSPVGEGSDQDAAKLLNGLVRYIQRECSADIAYDTAFENAAGAPGWGYWVIDREYPKPDTFNQNIIVRRVRNPFMVYMDPASIEPDGADAKYSFEAEMMPRADYEAEFPDAQAVPWEPKGQGDVPYKGWVEKDTIRVVRYWEYVSEKRTLVGLSNGAVLWKDELGEEALRQIEAGNLTVINERESDVPRVMLYLANAFEILKREEWPGRWIPIVKVIGDETDVDGVVTLSGIIRYAKEPQRMYNYMFSALVEAIALQPKAKWVAAEGQIEAYQDQWDNANRRATSTLTYSPVTFANGQMVPPPQMTPPAAVPAAVMAALQINAQDLQATTGVRFDATITERLTDESGKAIDELRRNTDIGCFHYTDNLSRSLKHTGRIFIDLIVKTFDARRVATILHDDDKEEQIIIDPNAPKAVGEQKDAATGKIRKILNPTVGEYSVTVTTGPSHSTRRKEAAESLLQFARVLPNTAEYIADIIAKYQDWEGGQELATRLAKVIAAKMPGIMTPDMKDTPPAVQAMISSLDGQVKQLTQQLMATAKALQDKNADRQLEWTKIQQDFEAKLLNVVAKLETAKSTHAGSQFADMVGAVERLMHMTGQHPAQALDAAKLISQHTLGAAAQEQKAAGDAAAPGGEAGGGTTP